MSQSGSEPITSRSRPCHCPSPTLHLSLLLTSHCFFPASFPESLPSPSRVALETQGIRQTPSLSPSMLDDLLALTTTLIHSDREQTPGDGGTSDSATDDMPPRSRHSKSASVASSSDATAAAKGADSVNGGMLPPASASDRATTTTRKRRASRSTTSPPTSPVVVIPATRKPESHPAPQRQRHYAKLVGTVILSVLLETGLQTAGSMVGPGDFAAISKTADAWPEILGLLAWKILKLGMYWTAGFDGKVTMVWCSSCDSPTD